MKRVLSFIEYYLRPAPGFRWIQPALDEFALRDWRRTHLPPPPRSVKVELIRRQVSPSRRALVETGLYYGDTLAMLCGEFEELHSIELSPRLVARGRRRFARQARVRIHQGDSGEVLSTVLRDLGRPAVLWLDGHYSGPLTARGPTDTPLTREIDAALRWGTPDDVLLVDDARLLGVDPAYPSVRDIEETIKTAHADWKVSLESDVLRVGRPLG